MFRLLIVAGLCATLAACATAPPEEAKVEPNEEAVAVAEPVKPVERPIPEDSLYPLLVAEFALRRNAYDVAMEQYLAQAEILRDPAISAHTTHLAQFLQREPEALAAVQLWAQLEPDNPEANNTLATLLVRQGRTAEALPHVAVVARSGAVANFPILLNGFRELPPKQRAELAAGIGQLATEFPDNTQLLLTQALIYDETGADDRALTELKALFKLEPYQPQALLLEAKILLEQEHKQPFAHIQEALAAQPEDSRLRLQYARLLTRGDMVGAREQFEILSAQAPRDADLLYSLALINHETGDNLAAKAYLRQLLSLDERTEEAHYYLGRIAEDEGDLEAAVSEYLAVVDPQNRDFYSARSRIGRLLISAGESERSQLYFNEWRQQYPQNREQLYAIEADLLNRAGELDASLKILNQALMDFPESTSLRYSRSMLGEQRNDLDLMERDLRQILELEPNNATALNALGYSLANRTKRYDEAHDLIARALELQPEEPAILDSMGWVLYRQGEYAQAVSYLNRAYALFPDPEVAAHLGDRYEEINRIPDGATRKNAALNFGWSDVVGADTCHNLPDCDPTQYDPPVHFYDKVSPHRGVTGGYVYRGEVLLQPELDGVYLFSDVASGYIWGLDADAIGEGFEVPAHQLLDAPSGIVSFGEDDAGELYVVSLDGTIYQLDLL